MEDEVGEVREVNRPDPAPADVGPGLPGSFASPRSVGNTAGDSKGPGSEAGQQPSTDLALAASSATQGNFVRDGNLIRGQTPFFLPGCSSAEVGVGIEAPPPPPNEEQMPLPLMPLAPPADEPEVEEGNERGSRFGPPAIRVPKMPSVKMPAKLQQAASVRPSELCCRLLRSAPRVYCEKLARFPWAFLLLYIIIIVTVIAAGWSARKLKIDTNLEQFRRVDGNASAIQAAYDESLRHQREIRNDSLLIDRRTFELEMFYQAKAGSVFSEASLRDIRSLEHQIRNLPGWVSMCNKAEPRAKFRCEPGESLGNYAWPQRTELLENAHEPFTLDFDGKSRERLPVHAYLTYLNEETAKPHELRKFLPHVFSSPEQDTNLLRSVFSFTEPGLDDGNYEQSYKDFVANELFPALQNATRQAETEPHDLWAEPWNVSIFFRGHLVDDHEVRVTLERDMKFSIGALVIMFAMMWLQLRSLFLALCGLITISLVPLIAYVNVQVEEVSLASFLCVFLVIGLGSNHLLACSEYWRRIGREYKWAEPQVVIARDQSALDQYYTLRLTKLFPKLFWRFLPEIFSMVCYLVLLASRLRPMREFGMFMFACMAYTALLCFTVFVPLLVIHDAYILPTVEKLPEKVAMVLEPKALRFPWRPLAGLCMKAARHAGKAILAGTVLLTLVIFIIMVVVAANSDNPGLPEVYSPSHHRHASRRLIEAFMPTKPAEEQPPFQALICAPGVTSLALRNGTRNCNLHWCEAPLKEGDSEETTTAKNASATVDSCACNEPLAPLSVKCQNITWEAEIVGKEFAALDATSQLETWKLHLQAMFPDADISPSGQPTRQPSLVLEHWESGKTDVEPQVKMPTVSIRRSKDGTSTECERHSTCFCGPRKCAPSSQKSRAAKEFQLATSRRLASAPAPPPVYHRRLSDGPAIPKPSAKEVFIVFGIETSSHEPFFSGGPKWSYDDTFQPVSPWAQRAMLSMCTDVPESLNVMEKNCWVIDFRSWMQSRGQDFPTRRFGDFQADLQVFRDLYPYAASAMWLNAQNEMRATAFSMKVPPRPEAWASEILEDRARWQHFVDVQNAKAYSPASNAFATAQVWADAEAQDAAMRNAWHVVIIAISVIILAGFVYTWDGLFMLVTIAICTLGCIWLAFFMFCIFGWAAGPWEVILMVVFLCYSVEPAFRIGYGAVWSDYGVGEKIMNNLSPRSRPGGLPAIEPAGGVLAIEDEQGGGAPPPGPPQPKTGAEADLLSSASTEARTLSEAASRFEARLSKYVLSVANATFGHTVKMICCGILMLPCEFRLFSRMGGVAIMAPLIALPCIFILLPAALFLLPRQDLPDAVRLWRFGMSKVMQDRE